MYVFARQRSDNFNTFRSKCRVLQKIMKDLSQRSRSPGRETYPGLPEYVTRHHDLVSVDRSAVT
jgi:hypothetical protein